MPVKNVYKGGETYLHRLVLQFDWWTHRYIGYVFMYYYNVCVYV